MEQSSSNKSWSIDDPSIRKQAKNMRVDPDAGLRSTDPHEEVLGSDVYRDDEHPPQHFYTPGPSDVLGSTDEEGGAATKDEVRRDVPIGPGNRKVVTSGAVKGFSTTVSGDLSEADDDSLARDESGAGLSEDARKGMVLPRETPPFE